MKKILNAMQHELTEEQKEELNVRFPGVIIDLKDYNSDLFKEISNTPGDELRCILLAEKFVEELENFDVVILPIGSPFFMFLVSGKMALRDLSTTVLFAYSERNVIEEKQADGSVVKKTIFKHQKFLEF